MAVLLELILPSQLAAAVGRTSSTSTVTPTQTPAPASTGLALTPAPPPPPPPALTPALTPAITARQQRVFEQFWNIINERYVYPDFRGVDWPKVRDDTQKKIISGISDADFYALLSNLIDNFKDDHSNFLSPEDAKAEDADYDGTGSYVGIGIISDINKDKRYAFVLTVLPNSPAEKIGIRAHDHILQIDGQPSVNADGQSQTRLLRGTAGTPVALIVRTPGQEPRTLMVTRASVASAEPIRQRILTDTGSARIGYVLLPSLFESTVATRARTTMRDLMKVKTNNRLDGLILDLRTNGGGTLDNLRALLGLFTSGSVGSLTNRDSDKTTIRVRPERIGNSQTVPLVVLTGPGTESFAEVLAATLQASGRATVIGQNSAGNIETLLSHEFEGGARLWLAEETFRLPNGKNFEGEGVTPNVRVAVGWDEFTEDNDPVIAAAVASLVKRKT